MNINRTKTNAVARVLLGSMLVTAGIGHLSFLRREFRAQVPNWVPLNTDDIVVYSGLAEIALGAALIAPGKYKTTMGKTGRFVFCSCVSWQRFAVHTPARCLWIEYRQ